MLMTHQQIFDKICLHFKDQQKRSFIPRIGCKYKIVNSKETLKCAVGCLIEDNEYDEIFDCTTSMSLTSMIDYFDNKHPIINSSNYNILYDLQYAHDTNFSAEQINYNLQNIATKYKLEFNHKIENWS